MYMQIYFHPVSIEAIGKLFLITLLKRGAHRELFKKSRNAEALPKHVV